VGEGATLRVCILIGFVHKIVNGLYDGSLNNPSSVEQIISSVKRINGNNEF
jgi:hypothetical protein